MTNAIYLAHRSTLSSRALVMGMMTLTLMGSAWAQKANGCLETKVEGKVTRLRNVCDQDISVAYCALATPSVVSLCGSKANSGVPYYTSMKNLKPGEKSDVYASNLATAVCLGKINSWATKGYFRADSDGSFECLKPTSNVPRDEVIATASTREAACKLASAGSDKQEDSAQSACECAALKNGRLFICKAGKQSADLDLLNAPGWLHRFIESKGEGLRKCDPERDPKQCVQTHRQPSVPIGVRG